MMIPLIVMLVGGLCSVIGNLVILYRAFKVSILWVLAIIFIPFAGLVFIIKYWEESRVPFMISLVGTMIVFLGVKMIDPNYEGNPLRAQHEQTADAADDADPPNIDNTGWEDYVPEGSESADSVMRDSHSAPVSESSVQEQEEESTDDSGIKWESNLSRSRPVASPSPKPPSPGNELLAGLSRKLGLKAQPSTAPKVRINEPAATPADTTKDLSYTRDKQEKLKMLVDEYRRRKHGYPPTPTPMSIPTAVSTTPPKRTPEIDLDINSFRTGKETPRTRAVSTPQ